MEIDTGPDFVYGCVLMLFTVGFVIALLLVLHYGMV